MKRVGTVRERERESNNLGDRCRGNLDFPHLRRTNPNCRGVHCTSVLQRNSPNCVGEILISRSTEKCPNNKIKNDNNISDCQRQPLQNTGITLIALIITIILLLILAGVTLHFTLGENGILRNAELAGNKYKLSSENEANLLDEIYEYMNGDRNYPENTPETNAGERVAMPDGWYRRNCCYI